MKKIMSGQKNVSEGNTKRHTLCMSQKLGFIDENGNIVKTEIRNSLVHLLHDEAKLEEIVNKCGVNKDTPEDTGFDLWLCMFDVTNPPPTWPHGLHYHH